VALPEENKNPDDKEKKKDEKEEKPPAENGGKTDKYIWTQTLDELHMYIYVDNSVRAKNVEVEL